MAPGLTIQTSYVFSKLLTDADSYWGNAIGGNLNNSGGGGGCCLAADQYNRGWKNRLENSMLLTISKPARLRPSIRQRQTVSDARAGRMDSGKLGY